MPGQLDERAVCWWCGADVVATVKSQWRGITTVEFLHKDDKLNDICRARVQIHDNARQFLEGLGVI